MREGAERSRYCADRGEYTGQPHIGVPSLPNGVGSIVNISRDSAYVHCIKPELRRCRLTVPIHRKNATSQGPSVYQRSNVVLYSGQRYVVLECHR